MLTTLTYSDLRIDPADIYEQMGYGGSVPDADVLAEIDALTEQVKRILRPRFCFFTVCGRLDTERHTLRVGDCKTPQTDFQSLQTDTEFALGQIISRQLRGSEAYAFFVATAGIEFQWLQDVLKANGDMVKVFIADAMGSVIAEKTADRMEECLQAEIDGLGWRHTNRFSPGYCGWHVSQQQLLFPLFGETQPCGVKLTSSSLMLPIKSVSGLIGLGSKVRKLEYTCGLCDYKDCYKRRKRNTPK